jgi:hypothetical protein
MKKIIITISFLLIGVFAVAWLYFKDINSSEKSVDKVFNLIPDDASLIFEYKNEDSFYDIFKDFTLFSDVIGKKDIDHLKALKNIFVDDELFKSHFSQNELFFSLHKTTKHHADLLVLVPLTRKQLENSEDILELLSSKYQLQKYSFDKNTIYSIPFNNHAKFFFSIYKSMVIGSFEENLLKLSLAKKEKSENNFLPKDNGFSETRNKNAIANLYINYNNLHQLMSNFSRKNNPVETFGLKSFDAFSSLNINYQSNAFMFSGITELRGNKKNYANIFLNQEPGKSTLMNILPFDAASYLCYFVSDHAKFTAGLNELFLLRKESDKRASQLKSIAQKHSINIEKEFPQTLGKEFGLIQIASGDKLGIVKTKNISRLSFLLSTISSEAEGTIRRFDDSDILYYYLGDPFKAFKRPYYTVIENHLIVGNHLPAIKRFLKNYENQEFLSRTDKNISFQQYLSNQGNIFYFIHNSNSKSVIGSYLNRDVYRNFRGDNFNWKNIYGLSIQFSADKNKFFTNLYMSKIPQEITRPILTDSLTLDTLLSGE